MKPIVRALAWACLCLALAGSACEPAISHKSEAVIERQTPIIQKNLEARSIELGAPIFIRIIKTFDGTLKDGVLELYTGADDGVYSLYKSWPICTYSGDLGPKLKEGDRQSPEGFYFVRPKQMNPNSSYHLSFNLGFPNSFDRAHGRTGSFLMVHGDCVSIGCYAMTDPVIEEIYTIMSAAFDKGQPFVRVHAFPFPMTGENLEKYENHQDIAFWRNLRQGWDWFETHKTPPNVTVHNKTYLFGE